MVIRIVPGKLRGTVTAPASKSELHRYLICAAFSDRPTVVRGVGNALAGDIAATVNCLKELGASFRYGNGEIEVIPADRIPQTPALDCEGSGSTLRFLLPVSAALCDSAVFTGNGSLTARPVRELLLALEQNGARFSRGQLPITMQEGLKEYRFAIAGDVSSQYISGLMLAGAVAPHGADIELTTSLGSAGYVDMTADALRRFGVQVDHDGNRYRVSGHLKSPGTVSVSGSWSAAAAILAAAAAGKNSDVTVEGLDPVSLQSDREIMVVLKDMGADISAHENGIRVKGADLRGTVLDVDMIPDLFPVLSAAASGARGTSEFRNGSRLRYKESDRLDSMHKLLGSLGVSCTETCDGLTVAGCSGAHSGEAETQADHRVVMAAAVAAYALDVEVTIHDAESVSKSYPGFFEDMKTLGGIIHVI